MSHWITFDNQVFADVDVASVVGAPGVGFYRLLVQMRFSWHGKPETDKIIVTNLQGMLNIKTEKGQHHFVGRLAHYDRRFPQESSSHTREDAVSFEVELDRKRIEAIEELRNGKNLLFDVTLYGTAYKKDRPEVKQIGETFNYRANQSEWIEALEQMGYRKTMLIEIPLFAENKISEAKEINGYILKAQDQMLHGNYREAVGACRDVFEALSTLLGDAPALSLDSIKEKLSDPRNMTKRDRIIFMRKATTVFTHPARHADDVGTPIEWTYCDARAAITITTAIIQLLNL